MGDWESKIIWDADDLSQISPPSLLTLDPNDENIIIGMPEDVVKDDKDTGSGSAADSRGVGRRGREKPDRTRTQALIGKTLEKTREEAEAAAAAAADAEKHNQQKDNLKNAGGKNPWNISNDEFYNAKQSTSSALHGAMGHGTCHFVICGVGNG